MDGALADYAKAIELNPHDSSAYISRAFAKKSKGDLGGALADLTKSIELDPKNVAAYHSRGCLHYDIHEWTNALADFRKCLEVDASYDYSHFRIWLVRARLGEAEAASKELSTYLENRKTGKPDDWESNIMRFLTGQTTEAALYSAAAHKDTWKEALQYCEAYFYAGSKRLIGGDKSVAGDYFQKCIATDIKECMEYRSAVAELKFLRQAK